MRPTWSVNQDLTKNEVLESITERCSCALKISVSENRSFIKHAKTFFVDHHPPHPPKPALSEHSTSNPATSSEHPRFQSLAIPAMHVPPDTPADSANRVEDNEVDEDSGDECDDDEEEDDSDSEAKTGRNNNIRQASDPNHLGPGVVTAEPSEFEMSEGIRLGSPDDGSNNLDSDFPMLNINNRVGNVAATGDHQRCAESTRRWQRAVQDTAMRSGGLHSPPSGPPPQPELSHEDAQYSQTVSTILQCQPGRWSESSSKSYAGYSSQSAFSKWSTRTVTVLHVPAEGTSQWLLKYILFSVALLHSQDRDENSPKSRDGGNRAAARFRKGTPADDLSANHVLAERRRRKKLNERFIILRSLVPFVTKMDKVSILGDTIEYVKQMRKKIQDLETRNRRVEAKSRSSLGGDLQRSSSMKELRSVAGASQGNDRGPVGKPASDKRKMRIVEAWSKPKAVEPLPPQPTPTETTVQVSIIESNALLEFQCPYREGLLLDVMQMLREHRIEVTAVQSSLTNGFFSAELRAKVKENENRKKANISEVKRAIEQIIPHTDS